MGAGSEIDALKAIDDALSKIDDSKARDRILEWAFKKYSSSPLPPNLIEDDGDGDTRVTKKKTAKKKKKAKKKGKGQSVTNLSIVKDLNLKPSGKKSFKEFVEAKKPSSNQEKCVVSVYYLNRELKLPNIKNIWGQSKNSHYKELLGK